MNSHRSTVRIKKETLEGDYMVRALRSKDLESVMEIWRNTNIQAHSFITEDYWNNNYNLVKEILPQAEVYIYETKGRIQGFIGIDSGYIAGLFVLQEEQSKGVGQALVEVVKEQYNQLSLKVYEKNIKAISFYEKQGFNKQSKAIDESTGEVEIFMVWEK